MITLISIDKHSKSSRDIPYHCYSTCRFVTTALTWAPLFLSICPFYLSFNRVSPLLLRNLFCSFRLLFRSSMVCPLLNLLLVTVVSVCPSVLLLGMIPSSLGLTRTFALNSTSLITCLWGVKIVFTSLSMSLKTLKLKGLSLSSSGYMVVLGS